MGIFCNSGLARRSLVNCTPDFPGIIQSKIKRSGRVHRPDLLILDWMMPGKSGVQFTKDLRASPELQN
ncbi:MAG: response regulator, partial [Burkholderiaceae bacterium]|nr:response regulator [Burkholderiaceae bacterium]